MSHYDYTRVDNFIEQCEIVIADNDPETAFEIITKDLDQCENRYLNDFIGGLNYLQTEKSLDWIESNSYRINNISQSWGHLAASSKLTWNRIVSWLLKGRPLSLIAIDGLMFCTTVGERLNQSLWMRDLNPRLPNLPEYKEVESVLKEYLDSDNVFRTRSSIDLILKNIQELENKNAC